MNRWQKRTPTLINLKIKDFQDLHMYILWYGTVGTTGTLLLLILLLLLSTVQEFFAIKYK